MDLINRYIYAVTKSLPEKQRKDIEDELKTLIDDMVEQNQGPESYEDKVKNVLMELGNPEDLADNYRGTKRYLIGPQYYDKYLLILKIVFGAVFIGVSIAVLVESIFSTQQNVYDIISGYFAALFYGLLQAFAWVTIAFVIAERNIMNTAKDISEKKQWNISQLPPVPHKKAQIPLSDPIFSIIFSTIFIVLLYSAPKLFAVYIPDDGGTTIIPVFNLEVIQGYRTLFICIFILNILKEVLKIYGRRWTLKLSVVLSVLSAASLILVLAVFANNHIWNPNFSNEIIEKMNLSSDFHTIWVRLKTGIIVGIAFFGVLDIVTLLYKGVKYNPSK